jgi:hypothetical protein
MAQIIRCVKKGYDGCDYDYFDNENRPIIYKVIDFLVELKKLGNIEANDLLEAKGSIMNNECNRYAELLGDNSENTVLKNRVWEVGNRLYNWSQGWPSDREVRNSRLNILKSHLINDIHCDRGIAEIINKVF